MAEMVVPVGKERATVAGAPYALLVLTLIYGVAQLDRQVISLLLPGIKRDMQTSDTVLGLITGFGFAALNVTAGLFAARWSDRGPRRSIIAGGLVLYSVMTALAGFSQNIVQLALTRIGVSIGEASGLAPSTALLSDFFPNERRARAMAIFAGGSFVSTLVGYPLTGWINQHYGWRPAFMAAGVPGLLMAALLQFTVADPPRGGTEAVVVETSVPSLGETLRFIAGQRSAILLFLAAASSGWALFALGMWGPTFLSRVHHLSPLEIGAYTGLVTGIGGLAGSLSGGFAADWAARHDPRLRLLVPAVGLTFACPAALVFLFAGDLRLMFAGQAMTAFCAVFPMGASWATIQSVVKVRMRALAASILLVFSTLIGLGVGPLVVGMLDDGLAPRFGAEAIRYSLLLPACLPLLGALLLAAASRYTTRDQARALAG